MTVLEVQGRGRQKGVCLQWRAGEYCVEFLPKLRIDMVVHDNIVETAIEAITAVAKTGKNGDGKIFVYPVEEVVRVSTGERGKEAILTVRLPFFLSILLKEVKCNEIIIIYSLCLISDRYIYYNYPVGIRMPDGDNIWN